MKRKAFVKTLFLAPFCYAVSKRSKANLLLAEPVTAYTQPMYSLYISASQCNYEVRINDVPLCLETKALGTTNDQTINHWVFNGWNTVEIIMRPSKIITTDGFGWAANASIRIECFEAATHENRTVVYSLQAPGVKEANKHLPEIRVKNQFWVTLPFNNNDFRTGVLLKNNDALLKEALALYKRLHDIYANKNFSDGLEMLQGRINHMRTAFYQSPKNKDEGIDDSLKAFKKFTDDPDRVLSPVDERTVKMLIFGDGHLVSLRLTNNIERSILYFTGKSDPKDRLYIPMMLYRPEEGSKLVIYD